MNAYAFDYITDDLGNIFIVRFADQSFPFVIAALVWVNGPFGFAKVKPYHSIPVLPHQRFFFSEPNTFAVSRNRIRNILQPKPVEENSIANGIAVRDLETVLEIGSIFLIGSRVVFGDHDTDYDYLVVLNSRNATDFLGNMDSMRLIKFDAKYFMQKAAQYAAVSCTDSQSLFSVTRYTLHYYRSRVTDKEIAFFPFFVLPPSEKTEAVDVMKTLLSPHKKDLITVRGRFASLGQALTNSFPRMFAIDTLNARYVVYSILWRIGNLERFFRFRQATLEITALSLGNNRLWVGGQGTSWKIASIVPTRKLSAFV